MPRPAAFQGSVRPLVHHATSGPALATVGPGPRPESCEVRVIKIGTHCRHGHELHDGNLYTSPRGRHACRVCRMESQKRNKPKHAEARRIYYQRWQQEHPEIWSARQREYRDRRRAAAEAKRLARPKRVTKPSKYSSDEEKRAARSARDKAKRAKATAERLAAKAAGVSKRHGNAGRPSQANKTGPTWREWHKRREAERIKRGTPSKVEIQEPVLTITDPWEDIPLGQVPIVYSPCRPASGR